ncbi:MAG: DMT family transporter [Pseudomonadota bacterium]
MKPYLYIALGLVAGIVVPIMAALNANLGGRMGSPFQAAAVLSAVAFLACLTAYLLSGALSGGIKWPGATAGYTAGFFFAVYIASITWLAPRIGVGNAVFLVLLGQLVSSATIDHFGLFGAPKVEITARRILGIAVMAVGVMLARRPV